jgi:hypothetical protein
VPNEPPPTLAALSLAEIAALAAGRGLPPVDEWRPERVSDSLMTIRADGRWFHDGGEIRRPAMIRAFSSLLWRDGAGQHWLVTPQEKQSIAVEDAAFIAVDVAAQGDTLAFRLNTDEVVIAGPAHPLVARGDAETPALYLAVRHGCEARVNRSTWLQLVELAGDVPTSSRSLLRASTRIDRMRFNRLPLELRQEGGALSSSLHLQNPVACRWAGSRSRRAMRPYRASRVCQCAARGPLRMRWRAGQ